MGAHKRTDRTICYVCNGMTPRRAGTRAGNYRADNEYELLDNTRVHPESYQFPIQMALDSLELEANSSEDKRLALERAMEVRQHTLSLNREGV